MKPRVATARALTAFTARQSLTLITTVYVVAVLMLVIGIWLLAHFFSPWWWVLAIPLAIITLIVFILRIVLSFIVSRIYRHPFSRIQREKLEKFTRNVMSLVETSKTPIYILSTMTIWEVIRHREPKTLRRTIDSSRSLKSDYVALEKYFGER